jgi:hypothetical protein
MSRVRRMACVLQPHRNVNALLQGLRRQTAGFLSFGPYTPCLFTGDLSSSLKPCNVEQQSDQSLRNKKMLLWFRNLLTTKRGRERVWKSGREQYSVVLTSAKRFEVDVYESEIGGEITHMIAISQMQSATNEEFEMSDRFEVREALSRHFTRQRQQVSFI